MNHTTARLALVVAVLLLPATAVAAELTPMHGSSLLVIDQISGFRAGAFGGPGFSYAGPIGVMHQSYTSARFNGTGDDVTRTTTFWIAPSADFVFSFGLSVGGLIELSSTSGSVDRQNGNGNTTVTNDLPTTTSFTFLPRVGYLFAIGDNFAIWPRGGIGYASNQTADPNNPDTKSSVSSAIIDIDVGFLWRPVEYVFFRLGPEAAFSLGGSHSTTARGTTLSANASLWQIGILGGVGAMFSL